MEQRIKGVCVLHSYESGPESDPAEAGDQFVNGLLGSLVKHRQVREVVQAEAAGAAPAVVGAGGGCLPAVGPVRAAARTHGAVGRVLGRASRLVAAGWAAFYPDGGVDFIGKPPGFGMEARATYVAEAYRKPGDEPEDWHDPSEMVADLEFLYWMGRHLTDSDVWPEWSGTSEFRAVREADRPGGNADLPSGIITSAGLFSAARQAGGRVTWLRTKPRTRAWPRAPGQIPDADQLLNCPQHRWCLPRRTDTSGLSAVFGWNNNAPPLVDRLSPGLPRSRTQPGLHRRRRACSRSWHRCDSGPVRHGPADPH